MMKILVTGVNGQLGYEVVKCLESRNIECRGVDIDDFDLTNRSDVIDYITNYAPDAVVHCAAFTAVDKAEEVRELCYSINVEGAESVALACKQLGAKMLYVSTDYVFNGQGEEFFETDSPKAPLNYYGLSKSMGEDKLMSLIDEYFIVRTSWVFGLNGNNFIKTMLRLGNERDSLTVVSDQVGSPTYAKDLAAVLCDMIVTDKYGEYHATNEGICSWFDFAKAIMEKAQLPCKVKPLTTKEYPRPAKRPAYSALSHTMLKITVKDEMRPWEDALEDFLHKEKEKGDLS